MADSSFDIVSKINRQEVNNALQQASKEIGTRFDFRGVGASITWSGQQGVEIRANSEERAKAVLDVFKDKLVKRKVSLKVLDADDPKLSGKEYRLAVGLKEGLSKRTPRRSRRSSGMRAERRQGPDPGRGIARLVQEEGRPAGGHLAAEGPGLRLRPAVRQLSDNRTAPGRRGARTSAPTPKIRAQH